MKPNDFWEFYRKNGGYSKMVNIQKMEGVVENLRAVSTHILKILVKNLKGNIREQFNTLEE